jgi:hypothetical protein
MLSGGSDMNKPRETVQFYDGVVPAWVKSITYRLSKTGRSVVLDLTGMMDLRSQMPGGEKKAYIPVGEWSQNPVGHINSFMYSCWSVQNRFYGSLAVHDARAALSKTELRRLATELKDLGLNIYKDLEAERIVRMRIKEGK